jgi:hypothetical protein
MELDLEAEAGTSSICCTSLTPGQGQNPITSVPNEVRAFV